MLHIKTKNKRRRSGADTVVTILDTPAKKAPDIVPHNFSRTFSGSSDAEENTGEPIERGIIEKGKRLSESMLWQLQRSYFDEAGSLAWRNNVVPSHATSNAYIAQAYARVVMGYLRDALAQGQRGPVHIIDLGAGSGQFAFHFLKKLDRLYRDSSVYNKVFYRYVIADFTSSNIDYCKRHPAMQSFINYGLLDFALLDMAKAQPVSIKLLQSGDTLASGSVSGPLVLIGNYLFDSIPQDLFSLQNGELYECLPRIANNNQGQSDMTGLPSMQSLDVDYDYRPVDADYYPETHFNALLAFYNETITNNTTHFTFPIAGLRFLDQIIAIADHGLLMLSADKGNGRIEQLYNKDKPYIAHHGGAFSLPVNFHLIGQYIQNYGGNYWLPKQYHQGTCVAGFLLDPETETPGTETRYAFEEAVNRYGPNDFFILKKNLERNFASMQLPEMLSYIRLSGYDSTAFIRSFDAIKAQAKTTTQAYKEEIKDICQQVWDNHYDLGRFNLDEKIKVLLHEIESSRH